RRSTLRPTMNPRTATSRANGCSNRYVRGSNTMRKLARILLAGLGLLAAPAFPQNQSGSTYDCDRACLAGFVDAWMNGLIANDASGIPLAPDAKITLNDDVVDVSDAFWDGAASVLARVDIANPRWGDTGTQAVVENEDGSRYLYALRLKVKDRAITEAESILVRNAEEGGLFDPSSLQTPNANFNIPIRPAEQDSYYDLVAAAESYWRAFNTNGTDEYRPAELWPNVPRVENGVKTANVAIGGDPPMTVAEQFDLGLHAGRNAWHLRYPVVDRSE